jgi:hypothetical protein
MSNRQAASPRQAQPADPTFILRLDVRMRQTRQDCWLYTWEREQGYLRLSGRQPGQDNLPADLAVLRLEDRAEIPVYDEAFAATNEREGAEIARQITTALVESGIKVFFVTHLYEFAHGLYESKQENALFLRAERQADGKRTFQLIEGDPLQISYGKDLYHQVFQTNE